MKKLPTRCPACGSVLEITELKCPECGTVIRGEFPINKFLSLDSENFEFLIVFLKSRGSLKEVQERLGISYPTAKSKLEKLLVALGIEKNEKPLNKMEVLESIEKGEISAEEAIRLLKKGDE